MCGLVGLKQPYWPIFILLPWLWVLYPKKHFPDQCQVGFSHVSAGSLKGLDFSLKSLIHFELILMYGVREWSNITLLHVRIPFSLYHFLKRLSFSHCLYLVSLTEVSWLDMYGFISGFFFLLCWSNILFFKKCSSLLFLSLLLYNIIWG